MSNGLTMPCAAIARPPTPANEIAPSRRRSAPISAPPSASPDSSAATSASLSGRGRGRHHGGLDADHEQPRLVGGARDRIRLRDDRSAGHDRDAGKPRARGFRDGARPDRRQVDAAVLSGLRRLDQHAARRPASGCARAARSSAMRASMPSVPSAASTASTWFGRDDRRLADVERSDRVQQREGARDVGAVALRWRSAPDRPFGHQDFRRHLMRADDAEAVLLEHLHDAREQVIVAAAIACATRAAAGATCPQSMRSARNGGRTAVPMKTTSRQPSARARRRKRSDLRRARASDADIVRPTRDRPSRASETARRAARARIDRVGDRDRQAAAAGRSSRAVHRRTAAARSVRRAHRVMIYSKSSTCAAQPASS